jgi:hypothetical protein
MSKRRLKFEEEDIIGKKFGMLTILERTDKKDKQNRPIVICKCDCGAICERSYRNMKSGETKSCGCLRRELARKSAKLLGEKFGKINILHCKHDNKLPYGKSAFNRLYTAYRYNSRKNNVEFCLTKDEFKLLTSSECHYCGSQPEKIYMCPRGHGVYVYNGIDKLDSDKGYIIENCVSCCWPCNLMKHKMSLNSFMEKIREIYHKHFGEIQ